MDYAKYGFPIGHDDRYIPTPATENHKSATQHTKQVEKYLQTEIKHRAILGPFVDLPFMRMMRSRLMTREKAGSTDRC